MHSHALAKEEFHGTYLQESATKIRLFKSTG